MTANRKSCKKLRVKTGTFRAADEWCCPHGYTAALGRTGSIALFIL